MAEGAPFKWTQWIAPLLIGTVAAGAVVWFGAHHEVTDPQTGEATTSWALLQQFEWSRRSTLALLGVIACVLVRDIGYIVRLRILSFQSFSWRQATENILLWELSSALTPSVVGGSAVAVVILKRDGLRWGKSLATVFATALMDEAFYLIAVPIVFLLASFGGQSVFPEGLELAAWGSLFWVAYAFIATLTTTIMLGLVIRPQGTYRGLQWARTTWLLRRWSDRCVYRRRHRHAGGRHQDEASPTHNPYLPPAQSSFHTRFLPTDHPVLFLVFSRWFTLCVSYCVSFVASYLISQLVSYRSFCFLLLFLIHYCPNSIIVCLCLIVFLLLFPLFVSRVVSLVRLDSTSRVQVSSARQSALGTAAMMMREEGFLALFSGLSARLMRIPIDQALKLSLYDVFKSVSTTLKQA